MKFGYIRVSRNKQATALQVDAMNREQCEKTFTDKMTGKHFDRPEFVKMIAALAEFERDIIQESTLAAKGGG